MTFETSNLDRSVPDNEKSDRTVENWCMCFHIVFTLTFTVIVLMLGVANAYVMCRDVSV